MFQYSVANQEGHATDILHTISSSHATRVYFQILRLHEFHNLKVLQHIHQQRLIINPHNTDKSLTCVPQHMFSSSPSMLTIRTGPTTFEAGSVHNPERTTHCVRQPSSTHFFQVRAVRLNEAWSHLVTLPSCMSVRHNPVVLPPGCTYSSPLRFATQMNTSVATMACFLLTARCSCLIFLTLRSRVAFCGLW